MVEQAKNSNTEYEALKEEVTLENLQTYKVQKMMQKFWMRFDKATIDEILTCGKEVI